MNNIVSSPAMTEFPGTKTMWFGFTQHDFSVNGQSYCIVSPRKKASGTPWIWRAEFFGHEPQVDLELLKKGWHLVYFISAAGLYGSPEAVKRWNLCYDYLTKKYGFSQKVVLEGFSRGGLLIYNWAAQNPDKVACIYADAPVCDIKSWPLGKGDSKPCHINLQACLDAYGFNEEQALKSTGNPIDNLKPIAQANIPLLHVCGDADDIVPMKENTSILQKRYTELGG